MTKSAFAKFDEVMRRVISVSHEELLRREHHWKENKKKRAKTLPASARASDSKV